MRPVAAEGCLSRNWPRSAGAIVSGNWPSSAQILREDFGPDSDIDVLVEFKRGHPVGLLRMAALERELSELLKRKVDLRTPAELSRYFRDEVLRTSEVQYVEGHHETDGLAACWRSGW